ncbi:DUF791-domain-containing protein [Lophiostoma macrostomum CBS 122681]|uniref:Molybdate-anion transporter n=1 Tax=Lophiostoma macrostomum CBS 122681 TaxID=1314788 RepID=A0A6A6SK39_9PLEO|nr:DUF791-domain-containing protein [Lophiostoma macrostomum CBS 122681]
MQTYAFNLIALVSVTLTIAYFSHRKKSKATDETSLEEIISKVSELKDAETTHFKKIYFGVYGLAVGADWLQGPYLYAHYRNTLGLPESTVAALFSTGFVSAAVVATFSGTLADRYGRARACTIFCILYSLSCFSMLSSDLVALFLGRILGGVSTTLLFSVFEAWMVAEYHAKSLDCDLGQIFSFAATLSSMTAIAAGVAGEGLIMCFETTAAPFMLAIVCLAFAGVGITLFWIEHYGESATNELNEKLDIDPSTSQKAGIDRPTLALGFAITVFEGSIYIFAVYWTAILSGTHAKSSDSDSPLPLGLIFSCLMCATMLGSMVYSKMLEWVGHDTKRILLWTFALAATALLGAVASLYETWTFWSFMLFEVCIGIYFPAMSKLKGDLVKESVRATIYALFRLPLNVFVIVMLNAFSRDDADQTPQLVTKEMALLVNSGLLLAAVPLLQVLL